MFSDKKPHPLKGLKEQGSKHTLGGVRSSRTWNACIPFVSLLVVGLVWELTSQLHLIPSYLLPAPSACIAALVRDKNLLWGHTLTTLIEAGLGLSLGALLGVIFALLMDSCEVLYRIIHPLLIVSQTIPAVAIAPLLVLWLGYDMAPKIVLVILMSFFPIAISSLEGLRSPSDDLIKLMKSLGASRLQILVELKIPAALPYFFSGLKVSAAYAIIGAVVAEWLGGFSGLGVYMTRVRKAFAFDRMFAAIFIVSLISLGLMQAVQLIQKLALPWKK